MIVLIFGSIRLSIMIPAVVGAATIAMVTTLRGIRSERGRRWSRQMQMRSLGEHKVG